MKIVVDAMGGDFAPGEIVQGAVEAARQWGMGILLVGDRSMVEKCLLAHDTEGLNIEVVHTTEVIDMGEHPGNAVRRKKDSSIVVGVKLVKEGKGAAFVSAGNTGACMAASLFGYGRIKGIDRPAIASAMPTAKGVSLLLDVGANADCKPQNLVQFGLMGQIYAEKILKIKAPKVGLLNIGEEEAKGSELTQEAYQQMKACVGLNFAGNAEGREVAGGDFDVVVCDGFVGNVILKYAEGLAKGLMGMIKEEVQQSTVAKAGALLMKPVFSKLKQTIDYSEYGGAPLLGVNGITIISHGSSKAKAIKNAVRVAGECVHLQVVEAIKSSLETNSSAGDEANNER